MVVAGGRDFLNVFGGILYPLRSCTKRRNIEISCGDSANTGDRAEGILGVLSGLSLN